MVAVAFVAALLAAFDAGRRWERQATIPANKAFFRLPTSGPPSSPTYTEFKGGAIY
jgi:hypothetical protein